MPDQSMLIVSDWKRIKEIDAAPEAVLSLQGAAKEILQPKHTMTNFNWMNKRGGDGAPLLMTLRNRLTGHLPVLLPQIRSSMSSLFDENVDSFPLVNGKSITQICPSLATLVAYFALPTVRCQTRGRLPYDYRGYCAFKCPCLLRTGTRSVLSNHYPCITYGRLTNRYISPGHKVHESGHEHDRAYTPHC